MEEARGDGSSHQPHPVVPERARIGRHPSQGRLASRPRRIPFTASSGNGDGADTPGGRGGADSRRAHVSRASAFASLEV